LRFASLSPSRPNGLDIKIETGIVQATNFRNTVLFLPLTPPGPPLDTAGSPRYRHENCPNEIFSNFQLGAAPIPSFTTLSRSAGVATMAHGGNVSHAMSWHPQPTSKAHYDDGIDSP
jgi:hypothetical protein